MVLVPEVGCHPPSLFGCSRVQFDRLGVVKFVTYHIVEDTVAKFPEIKLAQKL